MPSTPCPDCGASLDQLPAGELCPACGGRRPRAVEIVVPSLNLGMRAVAPTVSVVNDALAELAAMPADAARALVEEAKRLVAPVGEHRPGGAEPLTASAHLGVAVGVRQDAVFIPANARTWRDLLTPSADELRVAVLNAVVTAAVGYLVARHATPAASTSASPAADACRSAPTLVVEREPTPAPPLPPLVGPTDPGDTPKK